MARLIQSGFELNSATAGVEVTATTSGAISSIIPRTGTYALKSTGTSPSFIRFNWAASLTAGPFFIRFYFYIDTASNGTTTIFTSVNASNLQLKLTTANKLQLFNGASQIGSDSSALNTAQWYRIEVKFDNTGGAGAGIGEAKIDGSAFATSSALTFANNNDDFNLGSNINSEGKTGTYYFDDIAVNDSTGSFQNGYPGVGQIVHILPDSAGDQAQWTRAGTDTGANFSQVNEVTPDDAGTSVSTSTLNQEDLHNLAASPASIGSSDTINVVAVGLRVTGSGGGGNVLKAEIEASSGGTIEQGASITPPATYRTNNADANLPSLYSLVLYDLPGASTTPWTKSDLDTTQIGYKETTDTANTLNVTTAWLSVDSTPNAGGGVTQTVFPQRMRMGMGA